MASPYRITCQVGHSFEVALPDTIKVHNVFSADRLRKAANDPLLGQVNEPLLPIVIVTDQEWEVQEVLASKVTRKTLKYRVHWTGHDEDLI